MWPSIAHWPETIRLGLDRASSAREAVDVITDCMYIIAGYYGDVSGWGWIARRVRGRRWMWSQIVSILSAVTMVMFQAGVGACVECVGGGGCDLWAARAAWSGRAVLWGPLLRAVDVPRGLPHRRPPGGLGPGNRGAVLGSHQIH
jgi:hypothetical protein